MERISSFLSLEEKLPGALDVGCGTGLSTVALKALGRSVVGADASTEMLALAAREEGIQYCATRAEQLPFQAGAFDLITISSAFHWLDRDQFLKEAARVLRRAGRLVVYDNFFQGRMAENASFQAWYREQYLSKYPPPSRRSLEFTEENLSEAGFRLLGREQFQSSRSLAVETLVDYLLTQSNVTAAVEYGDELIEDVRGWLTENIEPFFGDMQEASFLFQGPIWYLEMQE